MAGARGRKRVAAAPEAAEAGAAKRASVREEVRADKGTRGEEDGAKAGPGPGEGLAAFGQAYLGGLRARVAGTGGAERGAGSGGVGNLEGHVEELVQLVTRTVETGENNSALLVGPRGCGKSTVAQEALDRLGARFGDRVCVARLHGLVHDEQKVALKEIARQLCLANGLEFSRVASYGENLSFLLDMLRECQGAEKTVLFVVDEFDAFASRAKQTLLYNLLDSMQNAQVRACVVGLTSRLDAVEMLEKRVRSRFSHRQLFILGLRSADEVQGVVKAFLDVPKRLAEDFPEAAARMSRALELAVEGDERVVKLLKTVFTLRNDAQFFLDMAFHAVRSASKSDVDCPAPAYAHWLEAYRRMRLSPGLDELAAGLTVLDLFLLVASNRMVDARGAELLTFDMVYGEYRRMTLTSAGNFVYPKNVVLKAFERLVDIEFLAAGDQLAGSAKASHLMAEHRPVRLLLTADDIKRVIGLQRNAPTFLLKALAHEGTHFGASEL